MDSSFELYSKNYIIYHHLKIFTIHQSATQSDLHFLKCLFLLRERERACTHTRLWESCRERERENPKQAPWCRCRALCRARSDEPWDRDLSQNQESDSQLTETPRHPEIPIYFKQVIKNHQTCKEICYVVLRFIFLFSLFGQGGLNLPGRTSETIL